MHWNGKGDYWNSLLVLQLSSVLHLWTIVRTTFVQLTLLLYHWTILRIYDASVRRLSVLFYTTIRFYASTLLRLTLLLHHCTILRIYDPTVRRLSVLFYTNVRLFACTLLRLSLLLHDWTILRIYDATVRRLAVFFYTTVRFCKFCELLLWISLRIMNGLRSHIKNSKESFIRYPNTSKSVKKTRLRLVFSAYFSGFGYPDETLFLVFDILHLRCYCTPTVSFVLHH